MTDAAINYPLSDNAVAIIAETNGVEPHHLPAEWRYAANEYMRDWMEVLGSMRAAGWQYRERDGQLFLPDDIRVCAFLAVSKDAA